MPRVSTEIQEKGWERSNDNICGTYFLNILPQRERERERE